MNDVRGDTQHSPSPSQRRNHVEHQSDTIEPIRERHAAPASTIPTNAENIARRLFEDDTSSSSSSNTPARTTPTNVVDIARSLADYDTYSSSSNSIPSVDGHR
ncbi:hypothetical protein RJT34_02877 [Clitoria ternatea]|uniref:Uncharacterized protein n=1 Tax=Clitoria ternatea TaxID=43366 RepID=A0AAN9KL46_CLITE